MTKQERAEKWFRHIRNAEFIDMERKMQICNKVAKKMLLVFLAIFLAECMLLFMISAGDIFNVASDFLFNISDGSHTRSHYKGVAIAGALMWLPLIILPAIAVIFLKKRFVQAEADKMIVNMAIDGVYREVAEAYQQEEKRPERIKEGNTEMNKEVYNQIARAMTDDMTILYNLQTCFDSPQQYYSEHSERYEDRGIIGDQADDFIAWIALADEMISGGAAIELDWKADGEEFFEEIQPLVNQHYLELQSDWIAAEGDITTWCEDLDEEWIDQVYCVGAMDIDSDSYVMFVCKDEVLEKLEELGNQIQHRFDFAKNM